MRIVKIFIDCLPQEMHKWECQNKQNKQISFILLSITFIFNTCFHSINMSDIELDNILI